MRESAQDRPDLPFTSKDWPVTTAQKRIVTFRGGVASVEATAGSGKTRTIIYTALDHLADGVDGRAILLLAYNKAAATEMQQRIIAWAPPQLKEAARTVQINTFHAYCLRLLAKADIRLTILSDREAKNAIGDILRSRDDYDSDPGDTLARICLIRETNPELPVREWAAQCGVSPQLTYTAQAYINRLRDDRLMDFTRMQEGALSLLNRNEDFRHRISDGLALAVVDEAQDLNPLRCAIWERLTRNATTTLLAGDSRQSVYGFCGAVPEIFLGWQDRGRLFSLGENFRSVPSIISAGNAILGEEVGTPVRTDDHPVVFIREVDAVSESEKVAGVVAGWLEEGTKPQDIAILYRTRAVSADLQIALCGKRVPYIVRGGAGFYGRRAVMEALAHLEAALKPSVDAVDRASRTPSRYLGVAFRQTMRKAASATKGDFLNPDLYPTGAMRRGVAMLRGHLRDVREALAGGDVVEGLQAVYGLIGAKGRRFDMSGPSTQLEERQEQLAALLTIATRFDSAQELINAAKAARSNEATDNKVKQAVTLSTAHSVKGAEWRRVVVVAMTEGLWPHWKSVEEGTQDEERRLAFVAVTRAKDRLVITHRKIHRNEAAAPSPYALAAIGETLLPPTQWPQVESWTKWIEGGCPTGGTPLARRGR